jgi:hypothetical protein
MKRNLLVTLFSLSVFIAQSQIEAREGKLSIKKSEKNTAVIELPYPPEVVEEAIRKQFALSGIKPDKSNGFQVFRAVKLEEFDDELSDLYFKVDRKSKKEKNVSVVNLIVAKRGEDIAAKSVDNAYTGSGGIRFLNNITPSVESHNLNVEIEKQDEVVKKSEKKLEQLQEEQLEMEKKIKKMQEKLEENKKNQEKQAEEIINQKKAQDALKSRKQN